MMLEHNQIWYTHDEFTAMGRNGITAWTHRFSEVRYGRRHLETGGYEEKTLYVAGELQGYRLLNFWNLESPAYKYTMCGHVEKLTARGKFEKKNKGE